MKNYIERASVFPAEKDQEFSGRLWDEFCALAYRECKLCGFAIEIAEKYNDENTPHYHMFWIHDNFQKYFCYENSVGICPADAEFSVSYKALLGREPYHGTVKIRLFADSDENEKLVREVFALYDEYVKEYYPEWETEYLEDTRRCTAIVKEAEKLNVPDGCGTISW